MLIQSYAAVCLALALLSSYNVSLSRHQVPALKTLFVHFVKSASQVNIDMKVVENKAMTMFNAWHWLTFTDEPRHIRCNMAYTTQ